MNAPGFSDSLNMRPSPWLPRAAVSTPEELRAAILALLREAGAPEVGRLDRDPLTRAAEGSSDGLKRSRLRGMLSRLML
jgi:hypothetical protein